MASYATDKRPTKRTMKKLLLIAGLFAFTGATQAAPVKNAELKPGTWKGVIQRPDGEQIVFNFEVKPVNGKKVLYVLNASERLLVDDIRQQGDSSGSACHSLMRILQPSSRAMAASKANTSR